MKHFLTFLTGLVAIAVVSCDSNDPSPLAGNGKEYFPLQKGWYQIYDVDEITYTLGEPETLAYELKLLVADSFLNAEKSFTYIIHRSKRNDGQTAWQNLDTWSVRLNGTEAVVNEENTPFVVLRFPVEQGIEWNGNAYNNEVNPNTNKPEDYYLLEKTGESYTVNDHIFENCAIVNQEDNQEFIVYFDKRTEVYAPNVGLVYKEKTQLNYCTDNQSCIGKQIVEEGVIYKQAIKEYGKEQG